MLPKKGGAVMSKETLYVSISDQRLYRYPDESPWEFKIEVDREMVPVFQQLFSQINNIEFANFWRAHLPYVPYHMDKENDQIDYRTKKLYALVHEYGDQESKEFIEQLPYFS